MANAWEPHVTRFEKLALASVLLGALAVASSELAVAEVRPAAVGAGQPAPRVLEFRVLLREYLEFRVGSRVTIRSNAGQVVITASDPHARPGAMPPATAQETAAGQDTAEPSAEPKPGHLMPPAAVVADSNKSGATNVCLYLEGTLPSCGDLSEVAGQVVYIASNP